MFIIYIKNIHDSFVKDILEHKSLPNDFVYLLGRINKPDKYKVNHTTTLNDLLNESILIGDFKCAITGHSYSKVLYKEDLNKPLREDMCGFSIIIFNESDCAFNIAYEYLKVLQSSELDEESKELLESLLDIFKRILMKEGRMNDLYYIRGKSLKLSNFLGYQIPVVSLLSTFYNEFEEHIISFKCEALECPSFCQIRIRDNCVGCNKCQTVCPVDCITGDKKELHIIDNSMCTYCGACIEVCPVEAITSGDNTTRFLNDLRSDKTVVCIVAPSVRVSISEAFNLDSGLNMEAKLASLLRTLGADYIFDIAYGADLTVVEESQEFINRILNKDKNKLPLLTSCCPAWLKMVEDFYPSLLNNASTAKSPMQILASAINNIWAPLNNKNRDNLRIVAIMPCTAKKYEASRLEFSYDNKYDVDYVITTSELVRITKNSQINIMDLNDSSFDNMLSEYSGSGMIFGRSGGVITALLRSVLAKYNDFDCDMEFIEHPNFKGFKTLSLNINNSNYKIGIINGLKNARKVLDKIVNKEIEFELIEIMACEGGCINGKGQVKMKNMEVALNNRALSLNEIDEHSKYKISITNPRVRELYDQYLDGFNSIKSHELFHIKYK